MEMTPKVSIYVPCLNEGKTIRMLLDAVARQTYPLELMEIVIADGFSTDNTREEIEKFDALKTGLRVVVVDNPKINIPAALNTAIEAARGEYVIRLDAHCIPHPEYISRCVAGLDQRMGDNVGGVWKIVPGADTWIAESIAAAASHPLGVGDAKYRYADTPGEADTVPFGAFRREYIQKIGGYDESLHTNEDYELNTRIRAAGGKLWLDPNIRVRYIARPTLAQLARQYTRYGYWKAQMLRRYPGSLRWRQALPPLFVLGLIALALTALWLPLGRSLLAAMLLLYLVALILSGLDVVFQNGKKPYLFIGVPIAIATMHLCWGGAFLWGLLANVFEKQRHAPAASYMRSDNQD